MARTTKQTPAYSVALYASGEVNYVVHLTENVDTDQESHTRVNKADTLESVRIVCIHSRSLSQR
jgi:hypothetical protein